ncbi:MAG: hypothetical protein K5770_15030 [Lachnospiraceae bacterium]|nr:hypothetical protein [Lachnospiraceae bacterium]
MKRRFISVIMAMSLAAISLSACGAVPATGGAEAPAAAQAEEQKADDTSAEQSGEKLWPDGTPVVYIGYGAGGGTDNAVRPVVAEMANYLGETINCQNMEGSNSATACDYVLDLDHDGYSMMATGSGGMSSWGVNEYTDHDWKDWYSFHAYSGPALIFANKDSGITDIDGILDYVAEGNSFGIGAYGNGPHTQFESIIAAKGISNPNYSVFGSCHDTGVACFAGDVACGAGSLSAVKEFIDADQLVPIAVTCADDFTFANGTTTESITKLVPGTDSVPGLNETWPILIPRDAPKEVIDKLVEAFNYALTTDAIKDYADSMGYTILGYTGEDGDKFLAQSLSGYAWTIYNAGLATVSPADLGIPTLEEFDWETEKAKLGE